MNILHISKTVELDDSDLLNGFYCPVCGVFYKSNGTGPANEPMITDALHDLPSEAIVGGIAPAFHDVAYLLCSVGWRVKYKDHEAHDKNSADLCYKYLIEDENEKENTGFFSAERRWLVYCLAERNYLFVHAFGNSSYNHTH